MINDADVLTRLKAQATEDAPALTIQAEAVMRAGRRRQVTHRVLGATAGAAVAAAGVAIALTFAGSEPAAEPGPTEESPSVVPEYVAHAMPAILKEAALTPLDTLPEWTEFRIDAFAGDPDAALMPRPLPQGRWNEGSTWVLQGITDDGALTVTVKASDSTVEGVGPDTYCAATDLASTCSFSTLPDGRSVVQYVAPTRDPGVPDAMRAGRWYERVVKVYDPETGFSVEVTDGAPGSAPDVALARLWLTRAQLLDMASNSILDLDGALPQPADAADSSAAGE